MKFRTFQYLITLTYLLVVMIISPIVLLLNYGINPSLAGQWNLSVYMFILCTAEGLFLIIIFVGRLLRKIEFSNNGICLYSFNKPQMEVLWINIKRIYIDYKHIVKQYVFEDNDANNITCELTKNKLNKAIANCNNANIVILFSKLLSD